MDSLHFGNDNDGDIITSKLFCRYVISDVLSKNDRFDISELTYIKYMIQKARDTACKMYVKTGNERFRNIINNMNALLRNNVFKACLSYRQVLVRQNSIIINNRYILRIYRIWCTLINSMISLEIVYKSVCPKDSDEWTDKNVLVGSLRTRNQLDICLSNNFYHVPKERIDNHSSVEYIAIYQSKNLFGEYSGIYHWGRVIKSEVLKRCEITEIPKKSDEAYIKFTIDKWYRLDRPIISTGGGSLFGYTNLFMLFRATDIYQLYFDDFEEYKLFAALNQAISEGYNNVVYKYKSVHILIKDEYIIVIHNKNEIFKMKLADYKRNNGLWFIRLKNACNVK